MSIVLCELIGIQLFVWIVWSSDSLGRDPYSQIRICYIDINSRSHVYILHSIDIYRCITRNHRTAVHERVTQTQLRRKQISQTRLHVSTPIRFTQSSLIENATVLALISAHTDASRAVSSTTHVSTTYSRSMDQQFHGCKTVTYLCICSCKLTQSWNWDTVLMPRQGPAWVGVAFFEICVSSMPRPSYVEYNCEERRRQTIQLTNAIIHPPIYPSNKKLYSSHMQYMLLGITKRRRRRRRNNMLKINARSHHYSGTAYSRLGREVVEMTVAAVVHYSKMARSMMRVAVGSCRTPADARAVDGLPVLGSSF